MTGLEASGRGADESLRVIAGQPYGGLPASWPTSNFARQLWTVAQSVSFNLGMRYAAVDLGGWDTPDGQGPACSGFHYYPKHAAELSAALAAFSGAQEIRGEIGRAEGVGRAAGWERGCEA